MQGVTGLAVFSPVLSLSVRMWSTVSAFMLPNMLLSALIT